MVSGVLVNGVVGEGPMMRVRERKANCEYWLRAAVRHNLMILVQVGGAPLPDVLSLAAHAEEMQVSGVVSLPELFYRPRNVDQLVGYCQHVASRCHTRPFFYYHVPSMTGVDCRYHPINTRYPYPNPFSLWLLQWTWLSSVARPSD